MPSGTPYLEEARIISRSHRPAPDWAMTGNAIPVLKIDPARTAAARRVPLFSTLLDIRSAPAVTVILIAGGVPLAGRRTLIKGLALRLSSLLGTLE